MSIKAEDNIMLESQKPIYDIAADTDQYFWHTSTGTDTGAHITEIPKEDFLEDPENGGGNLLARSNGIAVRDGLTELARFGAEGMQIGKDDESHLEMDYHSFKQVDKGGKIYAEFSDLRDESGYATLVAYFTGDGDTTSFRMPVRTYFGDVYVNGQALASEDYAFVDAPMLADYTRLVLSTPPPNNAEIVVRYKTLSERAKCFTLGSRPLNGDKGLHSYAFGYIAEASGDCAVAEGISTQARGKCSRAQNGSTKAYGEYQTVIGFKNIPDYDSAFIIGNGMDGVLSRESNALTVDWGGNVDIAGVLTQGSDKRLKEHISYLNEDAVDFIRKLKPAHYIKDEAHHVGFYAQDVKEADEWDCMTGEMNGYMTLGYTELIAPLVAYCQHLEDRIRKLEEK